MFSLARRGLGLGFVVVDAVVSSLFWVVFSFFFANWVSARLGPPTLSGSLNWNTRNRRQKPVERENKGSPYLKGNLARVR